MHYETSIVCFQVDRHYDLSSDSAESKLKAGSSAAQAHQIILEARVPVHIDKILVAMGREITRNSKSSVTSALAAYARKGEIFIRTAANTFGLIELGHKAESIEDANPPENFGSPSSNYDLDDEIPF